MILAGLLALVAGEAAAQGIPLTDKLTSLNGSWVRDPARGAGGICGVPVADTITFDIAATPADANGVVFLGLVKLDRSDRLFGEMRTSTDAGWLTITTRVARTGGFTNVNRETYIVRRDALTVWRVLNVELPDGGEGKIDCGNRHAIVYTRKQ